VRAMRPGISQQPSTFRLLAETNFGFCFYPQMPFVPIRTDSEELNYETRKSGGLVKLWATNQSEGSQLADSP
jgi:hypothetical protein